MSKLDEFLSRLTKVRKTGHGTWLACCPAHDDKHPSLGVRLADDGTVLIRCYAQLCDVTEVAGAVGMEVTDFFPEKLPAGKDFVPQKRKPFPAADVLEAVAAEAELLAVIAADIGAGKDLSEDDRKRATLSALRLREARRISLG